VGAPNLSWQRRCGLTCSVPLGLEGMVRRELDAAGASLLDVHHDSVVTLRFCLPDTQAQALAARLNEAGQGRLAWLRGDEGG